MKGFCWHVHHDVLMEWCFDYDERVDFIKKHKPRHEQELRLRLFKPVQGDLPAAVVEAGRVFDEAGRVCNNAERAYDETRRAYNEAGRGRSAAGQAYDEANRAVGMARRTLTKALNDHRAEIEALHRIECPDCPWEHGKTIFATTAFFGAPATNSAPAPPQRPGA